VPSGSFSSLTPGAIPVCAVPGTAPNEVVVKKHKTGITNLKVTLAIFTILPFSARQQQLKVMRKRLAGPRMRHSRHRLSRHQGVAALHALQSAHLKIFCLAIALAPIATTSTVV
jgi:hypothetical protein